MPTGLEKLTVEVPFIKGQGQKSDQAVMEMDAPYYLRNVHLRKGSVPSKRCGHTALSSASEGAVSFSGPAIRRIVSVDDELVAITESVGSIGSGGGPGGSGDTVFAFAETIQKWKAFGKIQRPTLDVLYPISAHRPIISKIDTAVRATMMLTAEDPGNNSGFYATITDLESNTERYQAVVAGSLGGKIIKCVATTSYLVLVWQSDIDAGKDFQLTKWDPTTLTPTTYDLGVGDAAGADHADVAVNGDIVYISYTSSTTDVLVTRVDTATGTTLAPVTVETFGAGTQTPTSVTVASGELAVVYVAPSGGGPDTVKIRSTTDLTTLVFSGAALSVATGVTEAIDTRVVIVSASVRLVFWQVIYDDSTETTYAGGDLGGSGTPTAIFWARVEGTHTTLALGWAGGIRRSIELNFWGQPFLLNSRVFLPVVSPRFNTPVTDATMTSLGFYRGAYIVEVEATISSAQATFMPQAACMLDVVGRRLGRNTSVVSNKAYIAATRRRSDPGGDPNMRFRHLEHSQALTYVFDFADVYRWQPAIHDHMVAFAGAYPYVYDGKITHECGFAWRPEIMDVKLDTGGSLTEAETYSYRVTFEWRDAQGRRWMSQPNFSTESGTGTIGATDKTAHVSVSLLSLNMMLDAGFYFPGPLLAVLWRATAAQAAAGVYVRDNEQEFLPFETDNLDIQSSATDASIADNERLYIFGGELENYTAPPCRSICQHRDRLIAFNTEWRTLDYTKPIMADRGVEWSMSQRIPCPEDIVAIESLEHVCVAFSKKRIYVLEGAGPGPTGIPPDAFARLVLVNADIGCSEVNAAWRSPAGIIFKSAGGFWLLDRSMGVSYLGAPVEADFDYLETEGNLHALCGVVDEKNNCMRIYVEGILADVVYSDGFPSALARFNYWFDTGRWSVDQIQAGGPAWATYHRNRNYIANRGSIDGVIYEDPDVFTDEGEFYAQAIETGWIRFGDLQSFKRVWRTLISIEKPGDSTSTLRSVVSADFSSPINSDSFTDLQMGSGGPKMLRIHLFKQKVRSLKVSLIEAEGSDPDSSGFKFYGIGFELGMKRGAFKAATVSR